MLDDYCDIRDGLKVLDVGCGKAWVMRQWAERYDIVGTGIDNNSAFLDFARSRRPKRGNLDYIEGKAESFAAKPNSYDIALCLGATFALDGFVPAVEWMVKALKPGGALVVGDLTLKHRPTIAGHQHFPLDAVELASVVQRHGAEVTAMISASDADFERYASHHRHATMRWAREHLGHPDHDAVVEKSAADWGYYIRTIRPHLGWTIIVGRKAS